MGVWRSTAVISHPSLGGNGTNTWHADVDGIVETVENELGEVMTTLEAFYNGCNDVLAGGTVVLHDGVWVRADDESGDITDVEGFNSTSGTSVAPLPPSQCLVVGWGTATAGRRARGRTFVGPLGVNTLQDNGTPTETARSGLLTTAESLIESSEDPNGWELGVWSAADDAFRAFTRAGVANRFSVLRSRRD